METENKNRIKSRVNELEEALNSLTDTVVLSSNINIELREYAISEIRYYREQLCTYENYDAEEQAEILTGIYLIVEEVQLWQN